METLNCGNEDFALSCIRANMKYGKNKQREDIKSHHYIISFDPRDAPDNGLTVDRAQGLGLAYCKEHFPGHQAIVCTHPDGHNHSTVKDAICLSTSDAGTFYGKTGTGRVDGQDVNGWFIGYIETADNTYFSFPVADHDVLPLLTTSFVDIL